MEKELNINGKIYRLVEEEKPAYNVGQWYKSNKVNEIALVLDDEFRHVSFQDGEFVEASDVVRLPYDPKYRWQPADMEEVERLLIKEAGKYIGNRAGKIDSQLYAKGFNPSEFKITSVFYHKHSGEVRAVYGDNKESLTLFCPKSGNWAEIIEEKKPLYTNKYGTEFFEGDYPFFIKKDTLEIIGGNPYITIKSDDSIGAFSDNVDFSEIMTERECHRYLDENWDKLNK